MLDRNTLMTKLERLCLKVHVLITAEANVDLRRCFQPSFRSSRASAWACDRGGASPPSAAHPFTPRTSSPSWRTTVELWMQQTSDREASPPQSAFTVSLVPAASPWTVCRQGRGVGSLVGVSHTFHLLWGL